MTDLSNTLGGVAEKLASSLTSQRYKFIILFLFAIGSILTYLKTDDLLVSVLVFVLAIMILLFGMLGEDAKPRGWKAIWTFWLMLCFVFIAVLIIGIAFTVVFGDSDLSSEQEKLWQEHHEEKYNNLNLFAEDISKSISDNSTFFNAVSVEIDKEKNRDRKSDLISVVSALSAFEQCRETRCRRSNIQKLFSDRVVDIWANFRCYLNSLRDSGYGPTYASFLEDRYEKIEFVKIARNMKKQHGNSLRVCS